MKSFDVEWEKIHSTQAWGQYPPESVIRFVARNYYRVSDRKQIKILDFGCGGGANTWYLMREGFSVSAFDGSESAVKKTKQKLINEFGCCEADLSVQDAIELNYPDNSFDAVIDNFTICANTRENIQLMYQKCFSILKPGGKLYTAGFGIKTTGYQAGTRIEENTYRNIPVGPLADRGIAHFYDEQEFQDILEQAEFSNICINYNLYTDQGNTVDIISAIAEK